MCSAASASDLYIDFWTGTEAQLSTVLLTPPPSPPLSHYRGENSLYTETSKICFFCKYGFFLCSYLGSCFIIYDMGCSSMVGHIKMLFCFKSLPSTKKNRFRQTLTIRLTFCIGIKPCVIATWRIGNCCSLWPKRKKTIRIVCNKICEKVSLCREGFLFLPCNN